MAVEKYLNKKSWHPTSLSNQRRLYLAQERNAEEERQKERLRAELEKERVFERDMEAQRRAAAASTSSASPESMWCRAGEIERREKKSRLGRSKRQRKEEEEEHARAEMARNKRAMRFMYEAPPEARTQKDHDGAEDEKDTGVRDGGNKEEEGGGEEDGHQSELPQKTRDIYGRAIATDVQHEELRHAPREAGLGKSTVMRHSALGKAFYANGNKWSANEATWYSSVSLPSEKLALQEREERNQRLRLESTPMGMLEARAALVSSRLQLKDGAADWQIATEDGSTSSMLLPPPFPGDDDNSDDEDCDERRRRRRRRDHKDEKRRARKDKKRRARKEEKKRAREKEKEEARVNSENTALHVS